MSETKLSKRRKEIKKKRFDAAVRKMDAVSSFLYNAGAKSVYVFGSLLYPVLFDEMSDVDIYVEGLPSEKRKGIYAKIEEIFGEVKFDLFFDDDPLRAHIKQKIMKEGKLWKH